MDNNFLHQHLEKLIDKKKIYQTRISFIFFILYSNCMIFASIFNSLGLRPYIKYNGEYKYLTKEICNEISSKHEKIEIFTDYKVTSLRNDLKLYCDNKFDTVYYMIFAGIFIGGFIVSYFNDNHGRKKTILYTLPINAVFTFALFLILLLIKGPNFFIVVFLLLIISSTHWILIISCLIYICDIIPKNQTPVNICVILSSVPFSGVIYNFLYSFLFKENWTFILLFNSIISVLVLAFCFFYLIETPSFYLNNGNINKYVEQMKILLRKNSEDFVEGEFAFIKEYITKDIESKSGNSNGSIVEESLMEDVKKKNDGINLSEVKFLNNEYNDYNILGKLKMNQYSHLSLVKYPSQISNFLILILLHIVCIMLFTGLDDKTLIFYNGLDKDNYQNLKKTFYEEVLYYTLCFILYYVVIAFIKIRMFGIYKTIILSMIIIVCCFFCSFLSNDKKNSINYMVFLYIAKLCNAGNYLLLIISSVLIYPILLKSKGLSINISLGALGGMVQLLFNNRISSYDTHVKCYIFFIFFELCVSFMLPQKIGRVVNFQVPEIEQILKTEQEKQIESMVSHTEENDSDDDKDIKSQSQFDQFDTESKLKFKESHYLVISELNNNGNELNTDDKENEVDKRELDLGISNEQNNILNK